MRASFVIVLRFYGKRGMTVIRETDSYWWYITVAAQEEQEEILHSLAEISGGIGSELQELPKGARVRIYYRSDREISHWRENLLIAMEPWSGIRVEDIGKIENQQWNVRCEEAFPPLSIGENLVVLAPWHKGEEPREKIPLYINPGSAFGTGYHESTQIALELLEKHLRKGSSVLDLGTGSGILSIAAYKMGASLICARDIDPVAIDEVRHNLGLNAILEGAITLEVADLLAGFNRQTDALIANILFDVLIPMLPDVKNILAPGGIAYFSGLILPERERFLEAMASAGLTPLDERSKEEWWGVAAKVTP